LTLTIIGSISGREANRNGDRKQQGFEPIVLGQAIDEKDGRYHYQHELHHQPDEAIDPAVECGRHAPGGDFNAGRIACLLPKQSSLEEVLHSLSGAGVSSISLQRVSLEHAFLEAIHKGQPLVGEPPQAGDERALLAS
jgi:hypothetical protein